MSATSSVSPILLRGVSKTYRVGFWMNRNVHALRALDLEIGAGQVFGLLGPNGAGKSTTIKILMGLVQPSAGEALLFGRAPGSPAARRDVGFVPENPAPYEYLTAREFVTLAGRLFGLSGHELDQRVTKVLGDVGMDHAADLQIRRYSKGMVQRTAVAQALISRPKLLVLDEPTSGLDPLGRRHIRELILEERQKGTTILFCTHIISDVESLCDRVAVLVAGQRVREGSVLDLLSEQTPIVEVVVSGLDGPSVEALGFPLESIQQLESRVVIKVLDEHTQAFVRAVQDAGGRIGRLQPARFGLEELFLSAMAQAGTQKVGGAIQ